MYVESRMKPTDQTKEHVISTYVKPARLKGASVVQIRVGTVQKELGWTNRTPSVFSTLASKEFQQEAGVELIEKRGGPPSGGPSTTVQFVFRILDGDKAEPSSRESRTLPNGAGLEKLYGILADTFRQLGGGEAFLKAERADWGPDPWEKLAMEERARKGKGE